MNKLWYWKPSLSDSSPSFVPGVEPDDGTSACLDMLGFVKSRDFVKQFISLGPGHVGNAFNNKEIYISLDVVSSKFITTTTTR